MWQVTKIVCNHGLLFIYLFTHFGLFIDETQKLQELLRDKESDLENTEELLNNLQSEVQLLGHERKRLMGLQENLEQELEQSASAHNQLAEQKSENEKLKEIIDSLKLDLDEALHQGEVMVMEPSKSAKVNGIVYKISVI
jgi:cell shape-determining protein MreC